MNSSRATSRIRYLEGEKYLRFENHLRPRYQGINVLDDYYRMIVNNGFGRQ